MSPIDPISPGSSMDLSPISPAEATLLLNIPTTPVIAPAVYLPRLLTSFQNAASDIDNSRRLSIQFQLPTPSPLSLGQTPSIEARTPGLTQCRSGSSDWAASPTSNSHMISGSRQPPWRGSNPFGNYVTQRRVPSLVRQNANEGLERLLSEHSIYPSEELTSLPLRVNTRLPTTAKETSHRRHKSPLKQSSSQSSKSASKSQTQTSPHNITLLKPRSRSPIRKSKHQRNHSNLYRRRLSCPTPTLLIRDPPSPGTAAREADLKARLTHLSRGLVPLVSVNTGLPHPEFPTNLLRYQLLTHEQLDALARWYHQSGDAGRERWMYPAPVEVGKVWCGSEVTRDEEGEDVVVVDLETKRRRWGRFIGLQGCESPVDEEDEESREDLEARMEREWRDALRRAREADRVKEKIWRGKF